MLEKSRFLRNDGAFFDRRCRCIAVNMFVNARHVVSGCSSEQYTSAIVGWGSSVGSRHSPRSAGCSLNKRGKRFDPVTELGRWTMLIGGIYTLAGHGMSETGREAQFPMWSSIATVPPPGNPRGPWRKPSAARRSALSSTLVAFRFMARTSTPFIKECRIEAIRYVR